MANEPFVFRLDDAPHGGTPRISGVVGELSIIVIPPYAVFIFHHVTNGFLEP